MPTRSLRFLSMIAVFGLVAGVMCSLPVESADLQELAKGDTAANPQTQYVCPPCGCDVDGTVLESPGTCTSCGMQLVAQAKVRNVAIVIWPRVELLDFAGPGEVFSSAKGPNGESFRVYTVAKTKDAIVSQGFVTIQPEFSIEDCPKPDIIVLPGGGTNSPTGDPEMMEWVAKTAGESEIALSVCTGAFILGKAGLLEGLDVTTWHGAINRLQAEFPNTKVHNDRRFIDNGQIVTSAGVSAGIDSSLHVVTRLFGLESARNTARYMEYDWQPEKFGDADADSSTGSSLKDAADAGDGKQ